MKLFGSDEDPEDRDLTPEEEKAWQVGVERVAAEKRQALRDPGPSWKEWFFFDHARWWVALLFLIVDVWIVTSWISGGTATVLDAVGVSLSLAGAIYLEVLGYRYLWRRPAEDEPRRHGPFRPSWKALREVGRWTPEAQRIRQGRAMRGPQDGSPNPHEFL